MLLRSLLLAYGVLSTAQAITPLIWNNDTFLLHGKPFQIIGGQMDPQRIPHVLWADRLSKARAMGLNTIFSYVCWDQLEPLKGTRDSSGNNDIARYFMTAQEQGLNVVLRPGPYICAEHEWAGFPAWLSEVPGMVVRANNKLFLDAARSYIENLAKGLAPLAVTNGGPILMVQVENEYGSYGNDHQYVGALQDITKSMLEGGQIHGALAETDGGPRTGFSARDDNKSYQTDAGDASKIQSIQSDLEWILKQNGSFSIYMSHGGTNWGFQNGADWGDVLEPVITSYDYGAPLDESGRPNDIYDVIRQTIGSYVGADTIPLVPVYKPLVEIAPIKLTPSVGLFDSLPKPVRKQFPVDMEALDQSTGFTLYRHVATASTKGNLQPGDAPRNRVLVYLNGHHVGVIDNTYAAPSMVPLALKKHDVLDLFIEKLGLVNYGPRIIEQHKGIVGNVTVGGNILTDWEIYPFPMSTRPSPTSSSPKMPQPSIGSEPVFYTGNFDVDSVGDTFFELPGRIKGVGWLNEVNFSRYWIIGPQQRCISQESS